MAEEDLRVYAQAEASMRDSEQRRKHELEEVQKHVKGGF